MKPVEWCIESPITADNQEKAAEENVAHRNTALSTQDHYAIRNRLQGLHSVLNDPSPIVPYYIYLDPSDTIDPVDLEDMVYRIFEEFHQYAPQTYFDFAGFTDKAPGTDPSINIIGLANDYTFKDRTSWTGVAPLSWLGATPFHANGRKSLYLSSGFHIAIREELILGQKGSCEYSLEGTLRHEIGHAVGLLHSGGNALMSTGGRGSDTITWIDEVDLLSPEGTQAYFPEVSSPWHYLAKGLEIYITN